MRPIKFRGQRKDNGEWVEGDLIQPPNAAYILHTHNGVFKPFCPKEDQPVFSGNHYEVIPSTVGQFTGLCDCEGKEAYFGDEVQTYFDNGLSGDIGEIVWHETEGTIAIKGERGTYPLYFYPSWKVITHQEGEKDD